MIDCVNRLVVRLGNSFATLADKEKEYSSEKERLLKYEKLLDFVGYNADKLNKYEEQEIIYDAVKEINSTIKEYEAACYLLDSNDDGVLLLPQYRNARNYLETIINYLKITRDKINEVVKELEDSCVNMNLNKKYFMLLNEKNPFIEDIDEFIYLLDKENLTLDDKNKIIAFIIKSNVSNYKKRIKGEEK